MRRILLACTLSACIGVTAGAEDGDLLATPIEIPYSKFVLDNGLTLIVHEDHKAPIVAINVWYHVGSKNEKPGKTGFAHLFEHLMFNGTENFNDDYFKPLEKAGATDMNGTTNNDRTNYFQNVPVSALDLALWMESDRMGHLLGAIDQAKLDEQRGVVQNEKRQGENQPYGVTRQLLAENTYPEGHPYHWTVIGSMDDLNAAELDDVYTWFREYYGAANAVLSIAGDVDPQTVKADVERYFGDIESGPPVARQERWIAKRDGTHRQKVQDRVPQTRIYKVWNTPEWGSEEGQYLDLLSDVLAYGKNSRLYERLVYRDQIATNVSAYVYLREIGGQFLIVATAKAGVDLAEVESAVDEELARLLQDGPTDKELRRVKTQHLARFMRGVERIGGFGGKSDILAMSEVYAGTPDYYQVMLDYVRGAAREDLRNAGRRWLSNGVYILEVHPFPNYAARPEGVDRSVLPDPGAPPETKFPELHRATLDNGLEIVLAERHAAPVVTMDLIVDAGYAADSLAAPGTAKLAMDMLDEGTKRRNALEISEALAMLGAELSSSSTLDTCTVSLSALTPNLANSLDIFADVVLNPAFSETEFERRRQQQLASIAQEKVSPQMAGYRVFPGLLFGEGHAYGNPFTGSGTAESVNEITPGGLRQFHDAWFRPNNATLVVVGDITMAEFLPLIEARFGRWATGDIPTKEVPPRDPPARDAVYLIDRPGAQQSYIFAAQLAPAIDAETEPAVETMNRILGGSFTSRINMNLREDKHWSYGARSNVYPTTNQRFFIATAPVQTDKTAESLVELRKELAGIRGERPITRDELDKSVRNQTLRQAGQWETSGSVKSAIRQVVILGLPDDYYDTFDRRVERLEIEDLERAAASVVRPGQFVWLIVGDVAQIRQKIEALEFGSVQQVDADGNRVS